MYSKLHTQIPKHSTQTPKPYVNARYKQRHKGQNPEGWSTT